MRNRRNYYRVLHVQPDAPAAVIKSSYRALMLSLEMHPDRGGEHWNAALLNEAYTVLSDPETRSEYDRTRLFWRREAAGAAAGETRDPGDCREDAVERGPRCVFCSRVDTGEPERCPGCRSPTVLAQTLDLEESGQRSARRIAMNRPLAYFTDWPQGEGRPGRIRDLSPHGLLFDCAEPLRPHLIVKIDSAVLDATARVVRSVRRPGKPRHLHEIGVEFYTLAIRKTPGTFVSKLG